jgi:hypothetical protein
MVKARGARHGTEITTNKMIIGGSMKPFIRLFTVFAIVACSGTSCGGPFPLIESDHISVRECRLVGKYPGPSGYSSWGPPPVLGDFKYQTALKAKEAGATHIFWGEEKTGIIGTTVIGYAFDCTGVEMQKWAW